MKCKECIKQDLKSSIYIEHTTITLMCASSYYDEDGLYHHHDSNVLTTGYKCSNNHKWSIDSKTPYMCGCPDNNIN